MRDFRQIPMFYSYLEIPPFANPTLYSFKCWTTNTIWICVDLICTRMGNFLWKFQLSNVNHLGVSVFQCLLKCTAAWCWLGRCSVECPLLIPVVGDIRPPHRCRPIGSRHWHVSLESSYMELGHSALDIGSRSSGGESLGLGRTAKD